MAEELIGVGIYFDPSGVASGVRRAEGDLNRLTGIARNIGRAFAGYLGAQAILSGFRAITRATQEAETAQARLVGVLRATGNIAGQTAQGIESLADRLSMSTLFDDEAIKNAAASLLTFRNVTGETFERTLRLGADLATVFGEDIRSGVFQLGRALEDPIRGMQTLRRQGVVLSEAERTVVEQAIRHNDVRRAQTALLDAVQQRVGGTAEGANRGLTGAVHNLTVAWGNFLERLGQSPSVMSSVGRALQWIQGIIEGASETFNPSAALNEERIRTELERQRQRVRTLESGGPMQWYRVTGVIESRTRSPERDAALEGARQYAQRLEFALAEIEFDRDRAQRRRLDLMRQAARTRLSVATRDEDGDRRRATRTMRDDLRAVEAVNEQWIENRMQMIRLRNEFLSQRFDPSTLPTSFAGEDEMIRGAVRDREKFMDRLKALDDQAKASARGASQEYAALWNRALENSQDALANFFDRALAGNIKSFKSFTQEIIRLWRHMISQMLAEKALEALFSRVIGLLSGSKAVPIPAAPALPAMPDVPNVPLPVLPAGRVAAPSVPTVNLPAPTVRIAPMEPATVSLPSPRFVAAPSVPTVNLPAPTVRIAPMEPATVSLPSPRFVAPLVDLPVDAPPSPRRGGAAGAAQGGGDVFNLKVELNTNFVDAASGNAWLQGQKGTIVGMLVEAIQRSRAVRDGVRGR